MVTSLQERVLSFVQQLHTSESERKRLRENIDSLNHNLAQLSQYQEACADMENELHTLRKQVREDRWFGFNYCFLFYVCDMCIMITKWLLSLSYDGPTEFAYV